MALTMLRAVQSVIWHTLHRSLRAGEAAARPRKRHRTWGGPLSGHICLCLQVPLPWPARHPTEARSSGSVILFLPGSVCDAPGVLYQHQSPLGHIKGL